MQRLLYPICILVACILYPRQSHCEIYVDNGSVVQSITNATEPFTDNNPVARGQPIHQDEPPIKLDLCDCQVAAGAPGGLSCNKEGFFIAHFERQGQWVAGGGAVPLSRAICCRPCIPDELPDRLKSNNNNKNMVTNTSPFDTQNGGYGDPDNDDDDHDERSKDADRPLAIISLGCHPSSDALGIRCESSGRSFVSGFTDAVRVFTAVDTLYPINTAQCCTPALLLPNGDAWEVDRCDCHLSKDPTFPVNCGGNTTQDALIGFDYFRLSPLGQVVPIGPAKCCSMCLTGTVHPMDDCSELNRCNNNGVCLLGRCECLAGWGGADCSLPTGSSGQFNGRIPAWGVALIVIGSCLLAIFLLTGAAHLAEIIAEAREQRAVDGEDEEDGEEGSRRPLLIRIEGEDSGSVGSEDTACEEELEEVEERIEGTIERLRSSHGDFEGGGEEASSSLGSSPEVHETITATAAANMAADSGEQRPEEAAAAVPRPDALPVEVGGDEKWQQRSNAMQSYAGIGPLSNVDCVVCMIRPVQTVVVPCGHICLCRRCSRRLHRCPVCRKDIARRQRLYV